MSSQIFIILLPKYIILFLNQYCFPFHLNNRCHLRQGPEAVRLISLASHSLKIQNPKLIQKFYNNFKAKCRKFRP